MNYVSIRFNESSCNLKFKSDKNTDGLRRLKGKFFKYIFQSSALAGKRLRVEG